MKRTVIKHPLLKFLILLPIVFFVYKGLSGSASNYYLKWECWLESENPPTECKAETNYQFKG